MTESMGFKGQMLGHGSQKIKLKHEFPVLYSFHNDY